MASTKKMNQASSSSSLFQQQFETIRTQVFLPETEETWDAIARSITALAASCSDTESYTPAELVAVLRSISRPLVSAMNSERGRLSGVAIDLVAVVASSLGVAFEPLLSHFFPVLLALSSRTSKVTVARARTCIHTVIDATHLPSILSYLLHDVTDKSVSLRLTVVESALACMNCFNPPDLEKDVRAKEIEAIIRATARDANADIRKVSRKVFEAYKLLLPNRLEAFTAPLTPTTRKYLDVQKIADQPKPSYLPPPAKPALLSSSTSTMRGPSSRRPPTHTRSVSSPAVAPDLNVPVEIDQQAPRSRSRAKAEMPPPKLPESTQPSRQPVMVRPTSVIERKRVVSMTTAVRPVVPIAKPGTAERTRPVPVSFAPGRRLPVDNHDDRQPAKTTSVVARRVPVSEVQKPDAEKTIRTHPRIDTSVSTPAIRLASVAAPPVAEGSKPPVSRVARNKDGAPASKVVAVKPRAKEPARSNLTKPTLSQLSRAKTIDRRVPVPTVTKVQRAKIAPRKPLPPSKEEPQAPTATAATIAATPAGQAASSPSTSLLVSDHEQEPIENTQKEKRVQEEETSTVATRPETPQSETKIAEDTKAERDEAHITVSTVTEGLPDPAGLTTPPRAEKSNISSSKTPISELLLSIERGFLFTPSAPLSPPESYLTHGPSASLTIPFPLQRMWPSTEGSGEIGDKEFEGVRRLESRRALGDVAINK
ncbi:TOG domain-containing protein [Mycena venus]|uniref:TOG domain-containing protein n=1 Tax=Mycena venus TaxID=2733690 RepID=A0A8H6YNP5_9AGAR|nr:TOG domain-containing protein [Mycena venus]